MDLVRLQDLRPKIERKTKDFFRKITVAKEAFTAVDNQYAEFMRGDSLDITINLPSAVSKSTLSKWRVFCYMSGGFYAFGNEFKLEDGSDNITALNSSFKGAETAGYYGRGILTVQLFGDDGNIINSANVRVKILESNSKESFTPSIEFRDQILETVNGFDKHVEDKTAESISEISKTTSGKVAEAETEITEAKTSALGEVETAGANAVNEVNVATEEAKTVIDGWTDQNARLAKNENAISLLQADKLNRGALWFNKAKLTTATNNATTLPLTLCATVECDDWSAFKNTTGTWATGRGFNLLNSLSVKYSPDRFGGFNFGIGSANGNAWTEIYLVLGNNEAGGNFAQNYAAYNVPDAKKLTVCTTVSEIENFAVNFYVDGALLKTSANKPSTLANNIIGGASVMVTGNYGYATTGPQSKVSNVKVSRLKIFNCVLPATKADDTDGIGYTVEDYHNGVDEPPTMQDASATYRALLSLQDYTITNGSTQQVFDVSGNANDATATLSDDGSLKGSNDIAVSRLIDFIKGQSA